ncbi:unnamed protein product [Paramecium sonneborni]|uniref:Uncharacterized protein n=1 Tax=Paramecium sonneborni TaxID=65129 RepID=A0A8S1QZB0_9CILI|nr:unnamed protein product [Paramecium sonneborni]
MSQLQPNLFIENAIRDCVLVFSWDEVLEMRLLCSKKIYSNIYFRKLSVKRYTHIIEILNSQKKLQDSQLLSLRMEGFLS